MTNQKIKEYAKKKKIHHYEIAEELGMNEPMFSKLFRKEIDEHMKQSIIKAVDKIYCQKHPEEKPKKQPAKKKPESQAIGSGNSLFDALLVGEQNQ